jgi:lysylphosphatidylglycerol synthetase-like protein (DUF2156 family)
LCLLLAGSALLAWLVVAVVTTSPNGLIEYLIAQTAVWARGEQADEISLNFSVFADVLRADGTASWPLRAARWSLLRLDRLFQLERLFSFNRKFFPQWHVERLLAPPRHGWYRGGRPRATRSASSHIVRP